MQHDGRVVRHLADERDRRDAQLRRLDRALHGRAGSYRLRLTQRGGQVGRSLEMAGDDTVADAVLEALLGGVSRRVIVGKAWILVPATFGMRRLMVGPSNWLRRR
jgi:hypothetical protein